MLQQEHRPRYRPRAAAHTVCAAPGEDLRLLRYIAGIFLTGGCGKRCLAGNLACHGRGISLENELTGKDQRQN